MPILNSTRRISPLDINKNVSIGVAFPLDDNNMFKGTQTLKEQVKSNLLNLLLTEQGERVNEPNFGVGLKHHLFEQNIDIDSLNTEINAQINFYIPEISLIDTDINFFHPQNEEHISMSIDNLQATDRFTILKVMKIDSIMETLNHDHIDAIKLNIEGAEVASLLHMMKETKVRPTLISVKFELTRDKYSIETEKLQNDLATLLLSEYTLLHQDGDNCTFLYRE